MCGSSAAVRWCYGGEKAQDAVQRTSVGEVRDGVYTAAKDDGNGAAGAASVTVSTYESGAGGTMIAKDIAAPAAVMPRNEKAEATAAPSVHAGGGGAVITPLRTGMKERRIDTAAMEVQQGHGALTGTP